jgi:hypothetical protein
MRSGVGSRHMLLPGIDTILAAPYKYMVEDGVVHDIDKGDMDRWYVSNRLHWPIDD